MKPFSLLDAALDRSIVGGYTSIGYRLRERAWADGLPRMDGEVALVTGATSGLGTAAAAGFAELGASVRLLVRDAERGERTRGEVAAQTGNDDVRVVVCDLADLGSVRTAASEVLETNDRIDVLVNNAGVLPSERSESADGHELTFATNVLGPFLLTELLLDRLAASAPSRVINVSSGGMYSAKLNVDELLDPPGDFDGTRAYARTKRAEVVLTELWAERHASTGVTFASMHPGWADTGGVQASLPRFYKVAKPLLRTAEQGADTIVWLGAAEEPARSNGRFWQDRAQRPTHFLPFTRESSAERERLWATCADLAGLDTR